MSKVKRQHLSTIFVFQLTDATLLRNLQLCSHRLCLLFCTISVYSFNHLSLFRRICRAIFLTASKANSNFLKSEGGPIFSHTTFTSPIAWGCAQRPNWKRRFSYLHKQIFAIEIYFVPIELDNGVWCTWYLLSIFTSTVFEPIPTTDSSVHELFMANYHRSRLYNYINFASRT